MEIWIIGGAIVALMVYTSTRIKKRAAEAYSREEVETPTYSFTKPEGFICPAGQLGPETVFLRSQGYGETEASETVLQAEGGLTVHLRGQSGIIEELSSSGENVEKHLSNGGTVLRREIKEGPLSFVEFHKLVGDGASKTYEFKVRVLREHLDQFEEKASELTSSFRLNA